MARHAAATTPASILCSHTLTEGRFSFLLLPARHRCASAIPMPLVDQQETNALLYTDP
jgi:hypothetical protein